MISRYWALSLRSWHRTPWFEFTPAAGHDTRDSSPALAVNGRLGASSRKQRGIHAGSSNVDIDFLRCFRLFQMVSDCFILLETETLEV